ncbi:hypothetical protein C8R42DRAFT_647302 [Lentinula raphanica]|nr:hypothetical protein C8R42DRAFT_647302 [Lentinula raphanica]
MATCTQCRDENEEWPCADFLQDPGAPTGTCVCGHSETKHTPALPPKGACPARACKGFVAPVTEPLTPRTRCAAFVGQGSEHCGAPYTSHLNMLQPVTTTRGLPVPPNVPAQRGTGAVTPWHPPALSNTTRSALTTNERRVASYQQAGQPGTSKLSTIGRHKSRGVSRHNFTPSAPPSLPGSSSKGKGKGKATVELTFQVVILPECCHADSNENADQDSDDVYPSAAAIVVKENDVKDLVDRLARYKLVFEVTVPHDLNLSEEIYSFLRDEIRSHFTYLDIRLTFPKGKVGSDGWYVIDTITKSRTTGIRKLPIQFKRHIPALNSKSFFERVELTNYLKKTTAVHSYLEGKFLFISPSASPMYLEDHPCIGFKLLYEWTIEYRPCVDDPEELQAQCLALCPSKRTHILHHPFPKHPSRDVSALPDPDAPLLRGPLEELGVDDDDDRDIQAGPSGLITLPESLNADDDEAADIARAIALSMQDQTSQRLTAHDHFSSAGAGPSRAVASISAPASFPTTGRRTRPLSPDEVEIVSTDTNHARRRRLNDDEPEHSVPWFITRLREHSAPRGGSIIVVTADTTLEAATALIHAYLATYAHSSTTVPSSVNLPRDKRTAKLGMHVNVALGDGVVRSVLNEALSIVMEEPIWIEITTGLKSLGFGTPVDQDGLAWIKTSGTILALGLIHLGTLPSNLSPAFLEAIIHGPESVEDVAFLTLFNQSWAAHIHEWPFDPNQEQPPTYVAELVNYYTNYKFAEFNERYKALKDAGRRELRAQVLYKAILDFPLGYPSTFDDHPYVQAFKMGFNLMFSDGTDLMKAFPRDTKVFLPYLMQSVPTSGDCIEKEGCIEWQDSFPDPDRRRYALKWKSWFYEYLRGTGHVWHSAYAGLISKADVDKHANDAGLRARSFLLHATGSMSMPRNNHKIKVSFSFNDTVDGAPPRAAFEVHACFSDVTVNICQYVRGLLDETVKDSQALSQGQITSTTPVYER